MIAKYSGNGYLTSIATQLYLEKKMNIKEMVSNGKKVTFTRYQKNNLWYITETGFEFPVPFFKPL